MKSALKVSKASNLELFNQITFLKQGMADIKQGNTLLNKLRIDIIEDQKYAVTTNARVMFWLPLPETVSIPVGCYEVESTKTTHYLTLDDTYTFPHWSAIAFGGTICDLLTAKLAESQITLDKKGRGLLNSIIGRCAPVGDEYACYVSDELLDRVFKGAGSIEWSITSIGHRDPIKLKSGELHAILMPMQF